MMPSLINITLQAILVGVAAGYLLRAWQTGSIFAEVIAGIETGSIQEVVRKCKLRRLIPLAVKLEELLLCKLCLAPYVAATLWLLIAVVPAVGLAVSGVFASAQIAYQLRSL